MLTFKIFHIKESPLKSDELKAYILHYLISYVHYCPKRDITLLNNYKYPKIKNNVLILNFTLMKKRVLMTEMLFKKKIEILYFIYFLYFPILMCYQRLTVEIQWQ